MNRTQRMVYWSLVVGAFGVILLFSRFWYIGAFLACMSILVMCVADVWNEVFHPPTKVVCPNCRSDISQYEVGGLAYTKHMVGECCIGESE